MVRRSLVVTLLLLGCSKPDAVEGAPPRPSAEPKPPVATPVPAPVPPPAASASPRRFERVLHVGDSMAAGPLSRALQAKVEAQGGKYVHDAWQGGIREFARLNRLPKLMQENRPDLVLLSLGAREVYEQEPKALAPFVEKAAKMTDGAECVWLGPPIVNERQLRIVAILREHALPCRYFDSSQLVMSRGPDGFHPDEKGAQVWAEELWKTLREPAGGP